MINSAARKIFWLTICWWFVILSKASREKRKSISLFTGNVKIGVFLVPELFERENNLFGQQSFEKTLCACDCASFFRQKDVVSEQRSFRWVISRNYNFPDISQLLSYMLFLYAYLKGNIVMFFKQFLHNRNNSRSQKWRLACDQLLVKEVSKRNCRFEVSILSRA